MPWLWGYVDRMALSSGMFFTFSLLFLMTARQQQPIRYIFHLFAFVFNNGKTTTAHQVCFSLFRFCF